MKTSKISVDKAINLIKTDKFNSSIEIDFQNDKIDVFDAVLLGKNGIDVPEELIEYDDDKIDYSDIPKITKEDLITGKIKWTYKAEFPMRKEINDWVKHEKIDVNKLLGVLVENFYKTMKDINKNAAL